MKRTPVANILSCPVCQAYAGAYNVVVGEYQIYKCSECGLEYTTPNPTDQQLSDFYRDYSDLRADEEIVRINAQRNLDVLRHLGFSEDSYLLDFGCGNGEFVEEAGPRAFGLELSTKPNKKRIYCELMEIPVSSYDFVTLWGVLEHLNDPLTTLRSLCAKLRPQGYLVMTTVDAEGHIPYYYKPPEHLTYWTRGALNVLAEDIGIEICQVFSYEMLQLSSVYLDRLLSRTPVQYRNLIISQARNLPRVITVPTNELMVVARRAINRC